jgi:hypothetical protein
VLTQRGAHSVVVQEVFSLQKTPWKQVELGDIYFAFTSFAMCPFNLILQGMWGRMHVGKGYTRRRPHVHCALPPLPTLAISIFPPSPIPTNALFPPSPSPAPAVASSPYNGVGLHDFAIAKQHHCSFLLLFGIMVRKLFTS